MNLKEPWDSFGKRSSCRTAQHLHDLIAINSLSVLPLLDGLHEHKILKDLSEDLSEEIAVFVRRLR